MAVVLLLALLWLLRDVVVLVFGGIVLAAVLRGIARRLERRFRLSPQRSGLLAALLVLALLAAVFAIAGGALADQLSRLRQELPQALTLLDRWLSSHALGQQLIEVVRSAMSSDSTGTWLATATTTTLGAVGSVVLMAIVSVYFATDVQGYRRGALRLVPPACRQRAVRALDASGQALGCWLLGQGLSMLFLGVTTAVGLALLGAPLALALGLITGLLTFVPFFGAIVAGVLSVLLAFIEGPRAALHVALLFFALQQVEEYLLQPFVQRWAVRLPPVLTLLSTLIFGVLFGPVGVVFGTPMMVVARVFVTKLYVEDVLGDREPQAEPQRQPAAEGERA
ncbi:AI-2E family transporter [Azohydromonas caseinilytica]|uniref:AI-2E family transporter n=1 Tax=Azohydromonas caseinilytica TaxID=2728836 RepID=A0A848FKE5_9BURK|nr:AI-2E family transporter [Azohydromonas caseinilytica]NML18713.1 AI-2E family transporter [Azohydromonas caseinilytica]